VKNQNDGNRVCCSLIHVLIFVREDFAAMPAAGPVILVLKDLKFIKISMEV
jgi:hypothetical protein